MTVKVSDQKESEYRKAFNREMRGRVDKVLETPMDTASQAFKNDLILSSKKGEKEYAGVRACVEILKGGEVSGVGVWEFFSNHRGSELKDSDFAAILSTHLPKTSKASESIIMNVAEHAPRESHLIEIFDRRIKPALHSIGALPNEDLYRMSALLFQMLKNKVGYGATLPDITSALEVGYAEAEKRVGTDEIASFKLTRLFKLGLARISNTEDRVSGAERRRLTEKYRKIIEQANKRSVAYFFDMPELLTLEPPAKQLKTQA